MSNRRYVTPSWPAEPFFLLAQDGGWTIGPFTPEGWDETPDGTVVWADGITHPVVLRVRGQEAAVIHANDGSVTLMDYRIVPVSTAPPDWLPGG